METYAQLIQDVIDEIKDSQVTDPVVRGFIAKAEPRISRDLMSGTFGADVPRQMLNIYQTATTTDKSLTLPPRFMKARTVRLDGILAEYVAAPLLGDPVFGQDSLPATVDYYAGLTPLSDTEQTNWLIEDAYDVYLWATCLQYETWGHEAQPMFRQWYAESIKSAKEVNSPQPRGRYFSKKKADPGAYYSIFGDKLRFA